MIKEREHKGVVYTNNDLIELLKLKNISMMNMVYISYHNYKQVLGFPDDYEFTISSVYKKNDYLTDNIHIYEDDLIIYNRNKRLKELIND